MANTTSTPLDELLRRPASERAEAASRLIASLDDGPDDPDAEQAQIEELERRMASIRDGTAEFVDGEQAHREIHEMLESMAKP